MSLWKWMLLNAYYHATQPARWWIYRTLAAQRRMPIAVVYYHRIADDGATEWTMPNRTFLDQMCWLRENFELISMEEVQRRMRSGVNDRAAVHVTFDDGYADNCQAAIPWLVKEQIPCTYFVTAQNTLEGRPFDHDLKCGAHLAPNSVPEIRAMANAGIEIGAHTYSHRRPGQGDRSGRVAPRIGRRPAGSCRGDRAADPLFRLSLRPASQLELPGICPGRPERL